MSTVSWTVVSRCFAELEERYSEQLGRLSFLGFNAWQIVKTPLFFNLVSKVSVTNSTPPGRKYATGLRSKFRSWFALVADLLYVLFCSKSKRPNEVLFYAFSVDKLGKNENGNYYNFIVDGWICDKIVDSYYYAEKSIHGEFRQPSAVSSDFNVDRLKNAALAYGLVGNREKYRQISNDIEKLLTKVLDDRRLMEALEADTINNILNLFAAEYRLSKIFLERKRPSLIISSEQPGSAFLAASIHLGIPTLDLQHGLVDKFHPQYIYAKSVLPIKSNMVLPKWLGVFGEFHKRILMSDGFWKADEIVLIGSKRVEINREKYASTNTSTSSMTLLLPTQWTVFEEMKTVLRALLLSLKDGMRIVLKMHPLENAAHIAGYEELVNSSEGKIEMFGEEVDIFPLINECRLMIGFDSTVLLESITFGKPAVTIGLPTSPLGIHSLFHETSLEQSIKVVSIENLDYLNELVHRAINDDEFYETWMQNAISQGNELYARNYQSNCRRFITSAFQQQIFEMNNN